MKSRNSGTIFATKERSAARPQPKKETLTEGNRPAVAQPLWHGDENRGGIVGRESSSAKAMADKNFARKKNLLPFGYAVQ
jgi:hypothetical protein